MRTEKSGAMRCKYIFVTMNIDHAGGVQCYVASKARYLESKGWDVFVLSSWGRNTTCINPLLNKYLNQRIKGMYMQPHMFPKWMVERTLSRMLRIVGPVVSDMDVIIESHDSLTCPWGELLAEKLQGRHYFYTMNEFYRHPSQTYLQQIEFYLYKFYRKEILGDIKTINRLLEGFRTVKIDDLPGVSMLDEAPIQEINSPIINTIQRQDWNICYIGRCEKPYVPNIFTGVGEFAGRHPDKCIQFLIVGEPENAREYLDCSVVENPNLTITTLGFLHPIPLSLYDKVDVVIAGSGCARHSAEVGALVIIADPETKQADGLLGYDTMSSIYRDEESVCTSFADALERALVDRVWENMNNRFPRRKDISESVEYQFHLYSMSDRKREYYNRQKLLNGKINWMRIATNFVMQTFPNFANKIRKIKRISKKADRNQRGWFQHVVFSIYRDNGLR